MTEHQAQRACDRCCSLKTQCDGDVPCARCRRLEIPCLNNRPLRRRGRPKKPPGQRRRAAKTAAPSRADPSPLPEQSPDTSGADADADDERPAALPDDGDGHGGDAGPIDRTAVSNTTDPDDGENSQDISEYQGHGLYDENTADNDGSSRVDEATSPIIANNTSRLDDGWIDGLSDVGFDRNVASAVFCQILAHIADWGFLSLVAHPDLTSQLLAGDRAFAWERVGPGYATELLFAVLAIGIDMEPDCLPPYLQQSKDLIVDTLRIEFLRHIPTLAWKTTDLTLPQCAALTLASYAWTLKQDLVGIADRWNDLAQLIWNEVRQQTGHAAASDLSDTMGRLLEMHNAVLGLLHSSRTTRSLTANLADITRQEARPNRTTAFEGSTSSFKLRIDEYQSHFSSFTRLLTEVSWPMRREGIMPKVRDALEVYFLEYPSHFLEFNSLEHGYQAESMIWFHGIFILTFLRQDLLDILLDDDLTSSPDFYSALEHALLLGEVLPTLLALDPDARKISPATVYFILVSAVVVSVGLWQFQCYLDPEDPIPVVFGVPEKLMGCAASHLQMLLVKSSQETTYTTGLIQSVVEVLSNLSSGLPIDVHAALEELAHFRWCEGGSGIRRLPRGSLGGLAQVWSSRLNSYVPCPMRLPTSDNGKAREERRSAVKALCSPAARICQPGCFDLSIQF